MPFKKIFDAAEVRLAIFVSNLRFYTLYNAQQRFGKETGGLVQQGVEVLCSRLAFRDIQVYLRWKKTEGPRHACGGEHSTDD